MHVAPSLSPPPLPHAPPPPGEYNNADDSMASFSGDGPAPKSPAAAMSLADLVADDEKNWGFRANNASNDAGELLQTSAAEDQTVAMEMTSVHHGGIVSAQNGGRADVTDHDLTADIPGPGYRTRALADHTGAFLDVTHGITRKMGGDEMELTNVYGGIVRAAGGRQSVGMDLTMTHGGIVGGRAMEFGAGGRESLMMDQDAVQELTGTISRSERVPPPARTMPHHL